MAMLIFYHAPFVFLSMRSAVSEEESEIFLSPAVTYGPPGLDLSCPIAMTIAHCAEVAADNWSIRLKRQAQDNKWEVRHFFFRPRILWCCVLTTNTRLLPAPRISL